MMKPMKQRPAPAARQLAITLDSARFRGKTPSERSEALALLAGLLLEAAGVATAESSDERV